MKKTLRFALILILGLAWAAPGRGGMYRPFFIWDSAVLTDSEGVPLMTGENPEDPDWSGIPGDLIQVISTGPDGLIDPPDDGGNPTGDDTVLKLTCIGVGNPWGYIFPGRFCYPFGAPLEEGEPDIYVRVFDDATLDNSHFYGESAAFTAASSASDDFDVVVYGLTQTDVQFKATAVPTRTPTPTPSPSPSPSVTPTRVPPTPPLPPSPVPTATAAPTASPTPSVIPSPTPEYCAPALAVGDLEDLDLVVTRAGAPDGWNWEIALASDPVETYGVVADNADVFMDGAAYPVQPVALHIVSASENVSILEGDYVAAAYDGGQIVNIYPPALSGNVDVYYYVGSDGSTYSDRWLCEPAKAVPSPTVSVTPSAVPSATPSLGPAPTSTPTPGASVTPSAVPSATPSPSPTPCYSNWYLAAGGTLINGYRFDEFVAILNPNDNEAQIEVTALDGEGVIVRGNRTVPALSRYTLSLADLVEGTRGEDNPSVSLIVADLSDSGIMVERSMYWNAGGLDWGAGHNSVASHVAALAWALPEGATHNFDEYIHVVNPGGTWAEATASVRITFLNESGQNWEILKEMPAETNWTVHVNDVVGSQYHVSTLVESLNGVGVSADRTMYWDGTGYDGTEVPWVGGHCSIGSSEQSTIWFVPEGATHMFDDYILVANPSRVQDADINVRLLGPEGLLKEYDRVVPPLTRYTIYVNREVGWHQPHVSAVIESVARPAPAPSPHSATYITVERAMYWKPFINDSWGAGHNSIGTTTPAATWYFAEGASRGFDEYILLANPDLEEETQVSLTFYFEDRDPIEVFETIEPATRKSIYVNKLVKAEALSCRVRVVGEQPEVIAERAMYWHSADPYVPWVAGHSSIGIARHNE